MTKTYNPPPPPTWRDEKPLPPARGLEALARGAPGPIDVDALEQDLAEIVRETKERRMISQPPALPPAPPAPVPIAPGPLTEEAKTLVSKSVIMGSEKMQQGAREAAEAYLADAQDLVRAVEEWCKVLEQQAQEMTATIARHHDSLIQARKLFQRAMSGDYRPDTPEPTPSAPTQEEPI